MQDSDQTFDAILAQLLARGVLSEGEIAATPAQVAQEFIAQVATSMLTALKRAAPRMLRKHKISDEGVARRNYRRWKKPLDLLELLWSISEEVGAKFNDTERPAAVVAKDYQFEALVSWQGHA